VNPSSPYLSSASLQPAAVGPAGIASTAYFVSTVFDRAHKVCAIDVRVAAGSHSLVAVGSLAGVGSLGVGIRLEAGRSCREAVS